VKLTNLEQIVEDFRKTQQKNLFYVLIHLYCQQFRGSFKNKIF